MNPASPGHEKPGKHVFHVPKLIERKQRAENEPAHVRRERLFTNVVDEAGTV